MRLAKCEMKEVNIYKLCKNQRLIKEFLDSGLPYARIEDFPHKNAKICCHVMRISVHRFKADNVKVILRGENVYFIRTDLVK